MDQLRVFIRSKQLAYRTEKTYCTWAVDFIRFHNMQHPKYMGGIQLDEYLSHLAVKRNLSINSQKTALNALVFMFKQFLNIEVGVLSFIPSSRPATIPTVFSHQEARAVIDQLHDLYKLMASLMYGSGLMRSGVSRLRVQDIDFANACIIAREAKGFFIFPLRLRSSISLVYRALSIGKNLISITSVYHEVYSFSST